MQNEASDGDIKKLSDKELDKAAKANGYKRAHDLKDDYGLDSKSDIGVDQDGNLYSAPRIKGQSGFQPLGINKDGT